MRVQRPFIPECVKQDAPFLNAGKLTWSTHTCQVIVLLRVVPQQRFSQYAQPTDTRWHITLVLYNPHRG